MGFNVMVWRMKLVVRSTDRPLGIYIEWLFVIQVFTTSLIAFIICMWPSFRFILNCVIINRLRYIFFHDWSGVCKADSQQHKVDHQHLVAAVYLSMGILEWCSFWRRNHNHLLTPPTTWDGGVLTWHHHSITYIQLLHLCFVCTRKLMRYAPSSEQPAQGRTAEQLSEDELPIFTAFSDEKYVSDVITYLKLEENKGRDRFHPKIYNFFKVRKHYF